jgi:hypothetical protein
VRMVFLAQRVRMPVQVDPRLPAESVARVDVALMLTAQNEARVDDPELADVTTEP